MATDSPVASAFVPAPDHWSRQGATVRAIVWHMAEGGGTVTWLQRLDGNSSHYVVEKSGRVVQMVRESEAAGSMNPRVTRESDDAPYTWGGEVIRYGRSALDASGISQDPNRYAIAVEVEGFAADGPNGDQVRSIQALGRDLRRRHPGAHHLGHRDQQSYKACPGKRFPWAELGGHGAPHQEVQDVKLTRVKAQDWKATGDANLFSEPDTSSEKVRSVKAGELVRTVAAAGAPDGSAWRLTEGLGETEPAWIRVTQPSGVPGPWSEVVTPGLADEWRALIDRLPAPAPTTDQEAIREAQRSILDDAVRALAAIRP